MFVIITQIKTFNSCFSKLSRNNFSLPANFPPFRKYAFLENMKNMKKEIPEIAEIVRHWMPNASDEELKEATINFRAYLAVLYRIFERLDQKGRLDEIRAVDKDSCLCGKCKFD